MAKEQRFTDPAFRCEVVLSGTAQRLYEVAFPQFDRLKGIKSLGLEAYIHDVGMHTRHQHLAGMMRIFNKLSQQPKEKGLPKAFLWSFWCRLCFAQTGHAAMSYDSEKAVLLACHLDSNFKGELRELLQPVIDKLAPCLTCTKQCQVKDKGMNEANEWFENLVQQNNWQRLYLWIAALKLVQEPNLLPILIGQNASKDTSIGFSEAEAFKLLCTPDCAWDLSMRNLSRLDFIVRDLAFAGTLGIQLDVDNLVAAADDNHPDWKILDSLSDYMLDTLYESLPAQTTSVLFQRALAALLIKGNITLHSLFGLDLEQALDDEMLRTEMHRTKAGREALDHDRRKFWREWPIDTYLDKNRMPCEVEREITGHKKEHLYHHVASHATCFKLCQDQGLAIAISHESLANRPNAVAFVKLCRSILNKHYRKLVPEQLTCALFEGLIDRKYQDGLELATERLSKLPIDHEILRKAADVANKYACKGSEGVGDFSFKICGHEYPFHGDPLEIQINAMHAALSDDLVRNNLDLSIEKAAKLLWEELTRWQTIYFGTDPQIKVADLLNEAQKHLAKQVFSGMDNAAENLELYTMLESLKYPRDAVVSFRVALPNLKLLKHDGTTENEYDVVSVVLKDNKDVEVWIWGVTTEADIRPKRKDDLDKIQKLKDLLGGRWAADVRVVTCYIYRDRSDICCEIDGRQERRGYSYS
jgi:hypothetical protein